MVYRILYDFLYITTIDFYLVYKIRILTMDDKYGWKSNIIYERKKNKGVSNELQTKFSRPIILYIYSHFKTPGGC